MSAKTAPRKTRYSHPHPLVPEGGRAVTITDKVQTLEELEEAITAVHDAYSPADPAIDLHLGLALMHVRKARGK